MVCKPSTNSLVAITSLEEFVQKQNNRFFQDGSQPNLKNTEFLAAALSKTDLFGGGDLPGIAVNCTRK